MLDSTKDIFWLIFAIVLGLFGLFVAWAMFYIAMLLREGRIIAKSVRKKLDFVDDILKIIKVKTERTANYIPPLVEGVSKLIQHFKDKDTKKKQTKSKKKKK